MHDHKHCGCKHILHYCEVCDVVYCSKCGREWGNQRTWWYQSNPTWTWNPTWTVVSGGTASTWTTKSSDTGEQTVTYHGHVGD